MKLRSPRHAARSTTLWSNGRGIALSLGCCSSIRKTQRARDEPAAFQHKGKRHHVDELNNVVSGARLEMVQLSPGPLRAPVSHCYSGAVAIDEGTVNVPLRIRGQLDSRRFSIGLFQAGSEAMFNGNRVDHSHLLFFMPGRELNGYIRESSGWTSLVVPSEWFEHMSQSSGGLRLHAGCGAIRPEASKLARLRAAIDSIKKPAVLPAIAPDRTGWLVADLRNALGEALRELESARLAPAFHSIGHFNTARRAERYMCERMDEPLCIDDLCAILRVSRRYLEYAFDDAFGTSPSRYLRLLRLNEVRRRLTKPGAPTTVTQEALRLGFNHLSLFSLQYKKAFGESPSATLSAKARPSGAAWSYADP
jgi:AraC family transcriptional regulator, ethanolamine operon transcriptional activator